MSSKIETKTGSVNFNSINSSSNTEEDLYEKYKQLQRQVELLDLQESYIRDEYMNLQRELLRAKRK